MEKETPSNFDDIRPLNNDEVVETIEYLINDIYFEKAATTFVQPVTWEQLSATMKGCKTKNDFQRFIIYPMMKQLIKKTTSELNGENWEAIKDEANHVIISNHRDIVLDAGFLNIINFDKGVTTTEIAIGDNLLIYPWIDKLVRLNKSFIVKRGVSVRQVLEASKHLSDYIHYTVENREQSVWIAQREGRAKDSNDKTQASLLKMLTLHNTSQPLETLKKLNILPLSISYEFDPSDYLKAKEFQLKRDNPEHKKTQYDDIENMRTGITGYKGQVTFRFGDCINQAIDRIPPGLGRNEMLEEVALLIDREIYKNYTFFPFNYVAYDLMTNSHAFASNYTDKNRTDFEAYVQQQIRKIDIPNKDVDFLRHKIIEMYGNTLKNHLHTD